MWKQGKLYYFKGCKLLHWRHVLVKDKFIICCLFYVFYLATLMSHSVKTVEDTYRLRNNTINAAVMSQNLTMLMRKSTECAEEVLQENFIDQFSAKSVNVANIRENMRKDSRLQHYNEKNLLDKIRYLISKSTKFIDSDSDLTSIREFPYDVMSVASDACGEQSTGGSLKFLKIDEELIKVKLGTLIKNNYRDTGARLQDMCEKDHELHHLWDRFGKNVFLRK